ncbi:MAG: metal-dependent transcriptional regulator [Treponema sp.]|mgnify:CR=1 FL=1|nr:metal-dependent transcriptional regulator [Treponema sp.]
MAIHKSGEDYLEAIYILKNKNGIVKSADVASFLNYSRASVCNAVNLLQKEDLLLMDEKKHLELTENGLQIAQKMYDRHCFLSNFLISIGVEKKIAEEESCQIEHILSEKTYELLKKHVEQNSKRI